MRYAFVDTDNNGTPTTPVHDSPTWPSAADRFASISACFANLTVQGETDDLTIYFQGVATDTSSACNTTAFQCASLTLEGNSNSGAWDDSKYVWSLGSSSQYQFTHGIAVALALKNVQIRHAGTSATINVAIRINSSSSGTVDIDSCFVVVSGASTGTAYGIVVEGAASVCNVYNSIVSVANIGSTIQGIRRGSGTVNIYNCVLSGPDSGTSIGVFAAAAATIYNSAVFGWSDDFNVSGTISNCASDDGDGSSPITPASWVEQFVSPATLDFNLLSDAVLIGAALTDPAGGLYLDDITGELRSVPWDIGAVEYVNIASDPTIDSVNSGAPIASAQAAVPVVGTLLEQVTAVRVVDSTAKAVDVTASWTGSGTSGTFDAPDFLTEGLKFGVIDVEFDWQ